MRSLRSQTVQTWGNTISHTHDIYGGVLCHVFDTRINDTTYGEASSSFAQDILLMVQCPEPVNEIDRQPEQDNGIGLMGECKRNVDIGQNGQHAERYLQRNDACQP
jgi:hypothetical protein